MFEIIDHLPQLLPGYMLILARISGLIITLPIISSPVINNKIKALIAIAFTLLIAPSLSIRFPDINSLLKLTGLMAMELFVGVTIGFGTLVIFESFNMAGSFMGRQMGFFMAKSINPATQKQSNIISPFLMLVVMLYFLITNTHYLFIRTIFENFKVIPLGMANYPAEQGRHIVATGSEAFRIAIRFAGPTMILLLLIQTATAFLVRVMPQMNVFFIILPLRIGTGLIALMTSLNIFQLIFDSFYNEMFSYLNTSILNLKG